MKALYVRLKSCSNDDGNIHLKINICEIVAILQLFLLDRVPHKVCYKCKDRSADEVNPDIENSL